MRALVLGLILVTCVAAFLAGRYWFPSESSVAVYLESNPEFLVDRPELIDLARPLAMERARAERRQQRRNLVADRWIEFLTAATTPRLGAATDPLVIAEFSDFACVPCKRNAEQVAFLAASNPDTQIVQVYVPTGGEGAELAARTAIAVWLHAAEDYYEVHHDLMATPIAHLDARARFWLDSPRFADKDLWHAIGSEQVLTAMERSRTMFDELNVKVVPSYLIDGALLTGPVLGDEVHQSIADARAALGS